VIRFSEDDGIVEKSSELLSLIELYRKSASGAAAGGEGIENEDGALL